VPSDFFNYDTDRCCSVKQKPDVEKGDEY